MNQNKSEVLSVEQANHMTDKLDDSDLVGNVECVVVGGEFDVGLLGTVWSDQCVDLKYKFTP